MNNVLDIWSQGVITQNVILLQGLGLFALTRYTKSIGSAMHAGVNMLVSMVSASLLVWLIQSVMPTSYGLEIPVLLGIAFLSAMFCNLVFSRAGFAQDMGVASVFNSALVGMLLLMTKNQVMGVELVALGFSASLGYGLVLVIMAGIRDRLEYAPVPKALRGVPILLISAGLLALAVMGYRF